MAKFRHVPHINLECRLLEPEGSTDPSGWYDQRNTTESEDLSVEVSVEEGLVDRALPITPEDLSWIPVYSHSESEFSMRKTLRDVLR